MLIAMAGLPGTGKSTLAAALAAELGAVILNKDAVRAALFPMPVLDCSRRQNDIAMAAIYSAACCILAAGEGRVVILDGRTFSQSYQVAELRAQAASVPVSLAIIECVCRDEVVRQRLQQDEGTGHPATNRSYDLYQGLKAGAETISASKFVVDTSQSAPQQCVERCLAYLGGFPQSRG